MSDEGRRALSSDVTAQRKQWLRFAPILLIVAGLAIGYALGLHEYLSLGYLAEKRDELKSLVDAHYAGSALAFLLVYIIAVAFSFPAASVLTVIGGFLFGWMLGGALVAVGATAGASIVFLATRSAFGDFLRRRAGGFVKKIADGVRDNAFGYLFVIRLAPVLPFFVVNIAAALVDITLGQFVAATFLGILPGTFAYAYLGQGVDGVLMTARMSGKAPELSDLVTTEITLAFLFIAIVAAIPTILAQFRKVRARRG